VIIVGPTGTGKSELAVRVAEALRGEIVGCDALQLYRGFDAATAKPTAEQHARVPHHLVDVLDPDATCSVGDYAQLATMAVAEIRARGAVPVVVGGSGMYLRGLLRGVVAAPPRNPVLLERLRAIVARGGSSRLHRWLQRLDPDSAHRLAPADGQRIVRALELALLTDTTLSERLRRDGTWSNAEGAVGSGEDKYPALKIGLDMERGELNRRLAKRVDGFFRAGLVSEVRQLLERVPRHANAFRGIGYREVVGSIEAGSDPAEVRDLICRNTRRYTKRQRTWFRKEPGLQWLDAGSDPGALTDDVLRLWRGGPMVYSRLQFDDGRDRT
jgi:tRNA dimethylallyltransferase